ncbi:MAG: hypothetical protein GEV10_05280 [Streptosporangiales bacterium]|nr:hypothetical protein [Streptosporangiales bacterium]
MTAATELAELVRDGDRLLVATGAAEPVSLVDDLLTIAAGQGVRLEILQVLTGSRGRILEALRYGHRVISPVPGHGAAGADVGVVPSSMRQLAGAIDRGTLRVDGVLFSGTRAAAGGVDPGLCVDLVPVAFERARFRAVELNAALPRVATDTLALDRCDLVVESDQAPPPLPPLEPDATAHAIAGHIAGLVDDGAVLELGVGRALAGVADALVHAGVSLSVHTGLVSDWSQRLVEAGVAERGLSCAGGVPVVGAVAMGSEAHYRWLDGGPSVRLVGSLHAHDPAHLGALGDYTAINAVSRIDLFGQVGTSPGLADRRAVGGLLDFATAGAYGGLSIVAVESVDTAGRSRITPSVAAAQLPGSLVTHVVTEHGVARLAHLSWRERVHAMVAIAHPDHRASLRRALERP